LNSLKIPQAEDAKYLGLPLEQIKLEETPSENNLEFNRAKLLGSKSQLSIKNKLLSYKPT